MRVALTAALVLHSSIIHAGDLIKPPAGFSWQRLTDIASAVLKPDCWIFKESSIGGNPQFTLTAPERLEGEASLPAFQLTAIIKGKVARDDPGKFVDSVLQGMTMRFKAVQTWDASAGPFAGRAGYFYDDTNQRPHRSFFEILVNRRTGTAFIVGFECEEAFWKERWEAAGHTICQLFSLDDEL